MASLRMTALAAAMLALTTSGAALAQQKVLRVVPHADLKVLDGYQTTATITAMHMATVYDTLFGWDINMEAKPQMVENYTVSPDKLTYTMTLRPGNSGWHRRARSSGNGKVSSCAWIRRRNRFGSSRCAGCKAPRTAGARGARATRRSRKSWPTRGSATP